jgi:hypothetical protein
MHIPCKPHLVYSDVIDENRQWNLSGPYLTLKILKNKPRRTENRVEGLQKSGHSRTPKTHLFKISENGHKSSWLCVECLLEERRMSAIA